MFSFTTIVISSLGNPQPSPPTKPNGKVLFDAKGAFKIEEFTSEIIYSTVETIEGAALYFYNQTNFLATHLLALSSPEVLNTTTRKMYASIKMNLRTGSHNTFVMVRFIGKNGTGSSISVDSDWLNFEYFNATLQSIQLSLQFF